MYVLRQFEERDFFLLEDFLLNDALVKHLIVKVKRLLVKKLVVEAFAIDRLHDVALRVDAVLVTFLGGFLVNVLEFLLLLHSVQMVSNKPLCVRRF